jgi:hypothetical protein
MMDGISVQRDAANPSMRRVYFDTQQWNYFVAPGTSSHPADAVKRVRRAQQDSLIEIVGSLDLLQELLEARRGQPDKAGQMLDLFFKLVGERILLPLDERNVEEALAGGELPQPGRYLSRKTRTRVRGFVQAGADASELIETLYQEKVAFKASEQELQDQMAERLATEIPGKRTPMMRKWIATVDIDDWVQDIANDPRLRERVPKDKVVLPEHLPSASTFVIARLGRLAMTMGEGRKIEPSDLADAQHVACGPYYDTLVTDDKALRATLDLVRDRLTFVYTSSHEFFATLP